jgi:hypothetical protein
LAQARWFIGLLAAALDDLRLRSPVRLFNLSLMSPGQAHDREPKHRCGVPSQTTRNLSRQRWISVQQRIAVVGHDNIDVGNNPTGQPGQPILQRSAASIGSTDARIDRQNPKRTERPICGAMSQQYSDSNRGNESAPQKFVHLVGCRDPKARSDKARSEPWVRPLPGPAKR